MAEFVQYDDGNLTQDGTYNYTYDAENRLIRVEPGKDPNNLVQGDRKLELRYDYMGRRVEKRVYTHNGTSWDLTTTRRFMYYNWLPLLELDVTNPGDPNETITILRKYTWGLDLAGLVGSAGVSPAIDDAGGISGLLATRDVGSSKSYIYLYDANGNVGQLVDLSDGSIDAKYQYDAYGNNLLDPSDPNESGPYADDNPFRFSTKHFDDELDYAATTNDGLCYFGYRYYTPRLARWLSRDPIGEQGATNLYQSVDNRPSGRVDPLGHQATQPASQPSSGGCCGPDVSGHIRSALLRVESYFQDIPNTTECNRTLMTICRGIHDPEYGWDILELAMVGAADHYADSPLTGDGCGTGDCAGTVQYAGDCYNANELNYLLWGLLNRLCNARKDEWLEPLADSNSLFSRDCDGNLVPSFIHSWPWTAAAVCGYRAGFGAGIFPHVPAAPTGQGSCGCRVAWAMVAYHGGSLPSECQRSACGTECCGEYRGPSFSVRAAGDWFP